MQFKSEVCLCIFGVLVAILLRCCTSLHSYSGQGKPPMYGDYEAQRHWMEVTVNLPINQWYKNSTDNDMLYWGLDYPPLTAYHSYICGLVAYFVNPNYVALRSSRGFESEDHKVFMRCTVLLADVLIFIPAVIFYFIVTKGKDKQIQISEYLSIILALFYPGIILIDHGHFQYNNVSLGFAVLATSFIGIRQNILATVCFCLALNYKQMELYHALPFFMYLLSICIPKPGLNLCTGFIKFCKIATTVLICFGIIWAPFLFNVQDFLQVVHRLFPVARGVYEDKVANIWCTINILLKLKTRFNDQQMLHYCFITTLVSVIPSSIDLFLRPNTKKFVPGLINSSLAFFLFSFQVHEKSILLAAIPVMLYLHIKPIFCFWFLNITIFSMFPLFVKDRLVTAFISLSIFYFASFYIIWEHVVNELSFSNKCRKLYSSLRKSENFQVYFKNLKQNFMLLHSIINCVAMCTSYVGCIVLIVAALMFEPPSAYPDIYPLLISVYACLHFLGFFVYFHIVQFNIPQAAEDVRFVKIKDD